MKQDFAAASLAFRLLVALVAACAFQASTTRASEADKPAAAEHPVDGSQKREGAEDDVAVITAGQEELLVDMLGKGATLPGPCKLNGAQVAHTVILSTYGCPGGEVVFELSHPSVAAAGATKTENFAVTLKSGTAPEGLTNALVERVRSKEGPFNWTWPGKPQTSTLWRTTTLLAGAGLLGGGALAWVLRRRRS